jgi:hypothetical protein
VVSRRRILASLIAAPITKIPLVAGASHQKSCYLLSEDHALSQDSRIGYERLLEEVNINRLPEASLARADIFIVTAAQLLSSERAFQLAGLVYRGSHLIYESGLGYAGSRQRSDQAHLLIDTLGIRTLTSRLPTGSDLYVSYLWPLESLVRSYGSVTPVSCHPEEVITQHAGAPVGFFRRMGQGSLTFLGCPLGLGLYAQEREARAIGVSLLKALAAARG